MRSPWSTGDSVWLGCSALHSVPTAHAVLVSISCWSGCSLAVLEPCNISIGSDLAAPHLCVPGTRAAPFSVFTCIAFFALLPQLQCNIAVGSGCASASVSAFPCTMRVRTPTAMFNVAASTCWVADGRDLRATRHRWIRRRTSHGCRTHEEAESHMQINDQVAENPELPPAGSAQPAVTVQARECGPSSPAVSALSICVTTPDLEAPPAASIIHYPALADARALRIDLSCRGLGAGDPEFELATDNVVALAKAIGLCL